MNTVFCIKNYYYSNQLYSDRKLFEKNKSYKYQYDITIDHNLNNNYDIKTIWIEYYDIETNKLMEHRFFMEFDDENRQFNEYFITLQELRKRKLDKINNTIIKDKP